MTLWRRWGFSSQPAECINKLRSLDLSAHSGWCWPCSAQVCTPIGLKSRLFVCEGNDIIVDALLLQLLQLFGCSFGVDCLRLRHGCICYGYKNKVCAHLVWFAVVRPWTTQPMDHTGGLIYCLQMMCVHIFQSIYISGSNTFSLISLKSTCWDLSCCCLLDGAFKGAPSAVFSEQAAKEQLFLFQEWAKFTVKLDIS